MSKRLKGKVPRKVVKAIDAFAADKKIKKSHALWKVLKEAREGGKKLFELDSGKQPISLKISNKRYESLDSYVKGKKLNKDEILNDAITRSSSIHSRLK